MLTTHFKNCKLQPFSNLIFSMRFFVTCFGAADPSATSKPLVPQPSPTLRRNKRNWRPSLGSISEDNAPPHKMRPSAGDVKRSNTTATDTAKVRHRHYSDDYDHGRVAIPAMMPAFSPTPFMF